MSPADLSVLPARDADDAARWVALKGLAPELARQDVGDDGVVTWTIPRWDGPDLSIRFVYVGGDGPTRLLTVPDLVDLAVRLVRSVPTRPQGLGPALLQTSLRAVEAARACRREIRRFPDPGIETAELDRVDALLDRLWEDVAAAAITATPFAADEMTMPGASFALPPGTELPTPPYPTLALRELLDRGWGLIDDHLPDRPEIGLLRHPQGAVLEVRVPPSGDGPEATVVEQRLVEGAEAMWAWATYGFDLGDELVASLGRALAPGRNIKDALTDALQGHVADARAIARFDAGNDRVLRIALVEQAQPRRRSCCLAVMTDLGDELLGAHLLRGAGGFDQLLRTLHRVAVAADPALVAVGRKLDETDGLRAHLGRLLLPGADPAAWVESVLPRPGDASRAFLPEVAAGVEASVAALRADPPRLQPRDAIDLTVAPVEELGGHKEFPGAYTELARVLQPGRLWATWVMRDANASKGVRYDGLVRLDDRWVWFPKPWRMIAHD